MYILLIILAILYPVASILTYAITLAHFYTRYGDFYYCRGFAVFMGAFGHLGLVVALLLGRHGFMFRWKGPGG